MWHVDLLFKLSIFPEVVFKDPKDRLKGIPKKKKEEKEKEKHELSELEFEESIMPEVSTGMSLRREGSTGWVEIMRSHIKVA
jgi:hypothetical protein